MYKRKPVTNGFKWLWLSISLFAFLLITVCSYHNGAAYKSQTVLGFPFHFYQYQVATNAVTLQMESSTYYSAGCLLLDMMLTSALVYLLLSAYQSIKNRKQ